MVYVPTFAQETNKIFCSVSGSYAPAAQEPVRHARTGIPQEGMKGAE